MPGIDLIELFVAPLNQLGLRYMVCGSVAAMLYGEPRLTNDIDLVMVLGADDARRLATLFSPAEFYLPPPEVIEIERARAQRGHFNLIHLGSGLKADCYLSGQDELHRWALSRVVTYTVASTPVRLAPPEYVILRKLEYWCEGGSEKHLRDIRAVLHVSGDHLDQALLAAWIQRLGLQAEWAKLQAPRP